MNAVAVRLCCETYPKVRPSIEQLPFAIVHIHLLVCRASRLEIPGSGPGADVSEGK